MALGVEAADGNRKLTVESRTLAGADLDLQAVQIQPILRPYTIFAVVRVATAAGDVADLSITWQATPRLSEANDVGSPIGMGGGGGTL